MSRSWIKLICPSRNAWRKPITVIVSTSEGLEPPPRVFIQLIDDGGHGEQGCNSGAVLNTCVRSSGHLVLGALPLPGSHSMLILTAELYSRSSKPACCSSHMALTNWVRLYWDILWPIIVSYCYIVGGGGEGGGVFEETLTTQACDSDRIYPSLP